MIFSTILLYIMTIVLASSTPQLRALIHNGTGDCAGCPESIGAMLENSPYNFDVHYAGPGQEFQVNADTLGQFDVYAQGGGPDLDLGWTELSSYKNDIQNFVSNGGTYLGFCLGAFYAGQDWFNLVPQGADVGSEINSTNAQVKTPKDTVIQVDWRFQNGSSIKGRWAYFQEGAVMTGIDYANVIGRYSNNQDVCASVTPYGKGWVGLVGIHPEADQSWYDHVNITNPDGANPDLGYDFVGQVIAMRDTPIPAGFVRLGLMYIARTLHRMTTVR